MDLSELALGGLILIRLQSLAEASKQITMLLYLWSKKTTPWNVPERFNLRSKGTPYYLLKKKYMQSWDTNFLLILKNLLHRQLEFIFEE